MHLDSTHWGDWQANKDRKEGGLAAAWLTVGKPNWDDSDPAFAPTFVIAQGRNVILMASHAQFRT